MTSTDKPAADDVMVVKFVQSFAIVVINTVKQQWRSTQAVWESIENGHHRLRELLARMPLVALTVRDDALYFGNRPVASTFSEVKAMGAHLGELGVAGIIFAPGLSKEEYAQVCDLLAKPVADIRKEGGFDILMAERRIGHVTIRRVRPGSAASVMKTMATAASPAAGANRWRILLVDDDVKLSDAVKAGLTAHGYQVRGENDSRRAMAVAREFLPDLIVLDMCMPNLDGGDVALKFGESPDTADIPILFLTSIVEPEEAARMTVEGQQFMAKPVRLADLAQRIEQCLRKRRR